MNTEHENTTDHTGRPGDELGGPKTCNACRESQDMRDFLIASLVFITITLAVWGVCYLILNAQFSPFGLLLGGCLGVVGLIVLYRRRQP